MKEATALCNRWLGQDTNLATKIQKRCSGKKGEVLKIRHTDSRDSWYWRHKLNDKFQSCAPGLYPYGLRWEAAHEVATGNLPYSRQGRHSKLEHYRPVSNPKTFKIKLLTYPETAFQAQPTQVKGGAEPHHKYTYHAQVNNYKHNNCAKLWWQAISNERNTQSAHVTSIFKNKRNNNNNNNNPLW
jgi:hypothetical protein